MNSRGFTLIELLLAVAILSILAVGGAPFYSRFFSQNAVENTTVQLLSSLRKAQLYSMTGKQSNNCTGSPCLWGVNYSTNTITLFLGTSYATRNQAFDEKFTVNTAIAVTGFTSVSFAQITGLPSSAPTITISGNGNSKTITVNTQGVATR